MRVDFNPRRKPRNLVVNHRRFFNYDKTLSAQRDSICIGDRVKKDFDRFIIGGGSAGLTAARFERQLDLSVAIVEKVVWAKIVPGSGTFSARHCSEPLSPPIPSERPLVSALSFLTQPSFSSLIWAALTRWCRRSSRPNHRTPCDQNEWKWPEARPDSLTLKEWQWTGERSAPAVFCFVAAPAR